MYENPNFTLFQLGVIYIYGQFMLCIYNGGESLSEVLDFRFLVTDHSNNDMQRPYGTKTFTTKPGSVIC